MAMAGLGSGPLWMKQAEDAKVKDEADKAAAARAAFAATFREQSQGVEGSGSAITSCGGGQGGNVAQAGEGSSDSDVEEADRLAGKPIGPVDPSKSTAAGTGVGGGAAGAAASFVVVAKDSDGRRVPHGGAQIRVKIVPGQGLGASEQEAVVKDHGDGTYTATYAVTKRGDYTVSVECNGKPISGSPFPVFFSGGNASLGVNLTASSSSGMLGQPISPFPNMATGLFPGALGMIPGLLPGATGGAILPGLGASLGEVCRDYLNGRCGRSDCKYNHPSQNQLMAALAAGSTMGGLSQMPMAPSAAAMAAAQSIAAAQAYQAVRLQAALQQQQLAASTDDLSRKDQHTLKVSNMNANLTEEQLRRLFSYCGIVTRCDIDESKQVAYVDFSKSDEAKAALALDNLEVGGRKLKVEVASSPASTTPSALQPPPLPIMMQHAVTMQQLQFQQALLLQQAMAAQQTVASQQAAVKAATLKSAAETSVARAAEISKRLNIGGEEKSDGSSRSQSRSRSKSRSKSRSRSPTKHRRDRQSPTRYRHDRHDRRSAYSHRGYSRDYGSHYRGDHDSHSRYRGRGEMDRSHYSGRRGSRSRMRRSRTPSRSQRQQNEVAHRSRRSRSNSKEKKKCVSESDRSRSRSPGRKMEKGSRLEVQSLQQKITVSRQENVEAKTTAIDSVVEINIENKVSNMSGALVQRHEDSIEVKESWSDLKDEQAPEEVDVSKVKPLEFESAVGDTSEHRKRRERHHRHRRNHNEDDVKEEEGKQKHRKKLSKEEESEKKRKKHKHSRKRSPSVVSDHSVGNKSRGGSTLDNSGCKRNSIRHRRRHREFSVSLSHSSTD